MPETEGVVWEEYHDRSAGLMIFGLIQIGLGVLAVLFCGLIAFSLAVSSTLGGGAQVETFRQFIPTYVLGAVVLVAMATLLTTLGVGSIMARRWARTLSLTLWATVLGYGVVMSLGWIFMVSAFGRMMEASMQAASTSSGQPANVPPGMASFMMVFMMVSALVLGVGVPLPFVLFYRSKHVKATCEWRDTVPRWTDRRPVSVLAASFLMLIMAFTILQSGVANVFFIGVRLEGAAAIAGAVIVCAVFLVAAAGLLGMRQWAWWLATAVMVFETAVWLYAAVLGRTDIFEANMAAMGNVAGSPAVPEFMAHTLWMVVFSYSVLTGYLIWMKRYLRPASIEVAPS